MFNVMWDDEAKEGSLVYHHQDGIREIVLIPTSSISKSMAELVRLDIKAFLVSGANSLNEPVLIKNEEMLRWRLTHISETMKNSRPELIEEIVMDAFGLDYRGL